MLGERWKEEDEHIFVHSRGAPCARPARHTRCSAQYLFGDLLHGRYEQAIPLAIGQPIHNIDRIGL